jgi:hypothetical protein
MVCDRYVQYLLTVANPSVLNRHRWGLQTLEVSAFHTPLIDLPNRRSSSFYLRAPSGLQIIKNLPQIPMFKFKGFMAATWSFDHSTIHCSLQLCLVIANDLSLAIGSLMIDQKVILIQLGHQFNSYNLMRIEKS